MKMQNFVWIQIDMDPDADAAIHKKKFGSGMTTLIISNQGTNEVMETVQSLGKFCLLIKYVKMC